MKGHGGGAAGGTHSADNDHVGGSDHRNVAERSATILAVQPQGHTLHATTADLYQNTEGLGDRHYCKSNCPRATLLLRLLLHVIRVYAMDPLSIRLEEQHEPGCSG